MLRNIVFIGLLLCIKSVSGQSAADSIRMLDTTANTIKRQINHHNTKTTQQISFNTIDSEKIVKGLYFKDSLPDILIAFRKDDTFKYSNHPYYRFTDPIHYAITIKKWQGKDVIFYTIIILLIFFAILKNTFRRYINDLFTIFFRTTLRQRQLKDQLVQTPLPSLLLNIYFLLSTGMFLALVLQYFKIVDEYNFWMLYVYCIIGLVAIYSLKYLSLKFFGWIFQISDVSNTYIFIVFSTNKIIGILLLPFLIVLTFTNGLINEVAITLSIIMVTGLLFYRYFLSYVSIYRQISISLFHFVIYFFAFEIAPLLLINKLLFKFLIETP